MIKIEKFNPQIKEEYIIEVMQTCPFTNIEERTEVNAQIVDYFSIQGSKFNLSFCYVSNYGLDCYVSFETVKIIKKTCKHK